MKKTYYESFFKRHPCEGDRKKIACLPGTHRYLVEDEVEYFGKNHSVQFIFCENHMKDYENKKTNGKLCS